MGDPGSAAKSNGECKRHSGVCAEIKNIKDRQAHDESTFERIWTTIGELSNGKVSRGLFFWVMGGAVAVSGTFFGLLYHSQYRVLEQISQVKTATAVIDTRLTAIERELSAVNGHSQKTDKGP